MSNTPKSLADLQKEIASPESAVQKMLELPKDPSSKKLKNKMVTFRVNEELYNKYAECCEKLGASKGSMFSMLLTKFVNENSK